MSRDSSADAWPAVRCESAAPAAAPAAAAGAISGGGAEPRALGGGTGPRALAGCGMASRGPARSGGGAASGCCCCCCREVPGASAGPSSRGRSARLARSDRGGTRRLSARGGIEGPPPPPPRGLAAGLASLLGHELLAALLLGASLLLQLRLLGGPLESILAARRLERLATAGESRGAQHSWATSGRAGRRAEGGAERLGCAHGTPVLTWRRLRSMSRSALTQCLPCLQAQRLQAFRHIHKEACIPIGLCGRQQAWPV